MVYEGPDRVPVIDPGGGDKLVKESMALASDVNQIVARHIAHSVPFTMDERATYGDFSNVGDFHSALNRVMLAQDEFARLPASVREYCQNDPGRFLDLVYDPARVPELVELGLVPAAVPVAAEVPAVVDPGAPAAPPPAPVAPV